MNSTFNRTSLRSSFVKFAASMNTNKLLATENNQTNKLLSRYQDQSFFSPFSYSQQKTRTKKRMETLITMLDKINLISPESTLLLWWNFLVLAAILFNLFQIPIVIFFTEQVYKDQFQSIAGIAINTVFITVLFLDLVVVRPNISFYASGRIVRSHRQSLKRYLKLEFWLNLIGWLILLAYAVSNNYHFIYAKILFYVYLVTLFRIDSQILTKLQLLRLRFALYKMLRVIFVLLFIVLWLSCIYFAIDYAYYLEQNQYYPVNLWLTNSQCSQYQGGTKFIDLVSMYEWYVWLNYAFYWTLQSISMVGYGDMTPRNPPQVVYCDIVVLLMTLMYAFFINIVWQIITQASQTANQFDNNKKYLVKYQKSYGLEDKTFNKLGSYMFEMWKHGKNQKIQQQITNQLTQDLRNQLLLAKQKKFFWGIGLFDRLSITSLDNIQLFRQWSYLIKQQKYGEQEQIFAISSKPEKIYSVLIGQILLEYPNSRIFNKYLEGTFGLFNFFTQQKYDFSCKSLSFSKVSYLERSEFLEALKFYPHVYEKYQQLVEQMKIYKYYENSGEQCWSCSSRAHRILQCPNYFQLYHSIKENAAIAIQMKQHTQKAEEKSMLISENLRSGPKRWKKNNRRQIIRRSVKTYKIYHRKNVIPIIQLDMVTYYTNYRHYGNI